MPKKEGVIEIEGSITEALELYRSTFRPSPELSEPRTFLTVNAVVAETVEEADRLVKPQELMMLALRTGSPLSAQHLVEEAEKIEIPASARPMIDAMRSKWVVGDAASARTQLLDLAATYGVDEVMVNPVAGAYVGTDADRAPAREETLRLLAA